MKTFFLIIVCLVIKISFAQNVNTFILTVENVDIKTKVEESVFVTCKLVNNSEAEIKISNFLLSF